MSNEIVFESSKLRISDKHHYLKKVKYQLYKCSHSKLNRFAIFSLITLAGRTESFAASSGASNPLHQVHEMLGGVGYIAMSVLFLFGVIAMAMGGKQIHRGEEGLAQIIGGAIMALSMVIMGAFYFIAGLSNAAITVEDINSFSE